jgi:hypothetical protein
MYISTRRYSGFCSQSSGTILASRPRDEVDRIDTVPYKPRLGLASTIEGTNNILCHGLDIVAIPIIVSNHYLVAACYLEALKYLLYLYEPMN